MKFRTLIWAFLLLVLISTQSGTSQQCGRNVPGHSEFRRINEFLRGALLKVRNSGEQGFRYWTTDTTGYKSGDPVISAGIKSLVFRVKFWVFIFPIYYNKRLDELISKGRFRIKNLDCTNLYVLNNANIGLYADHVTLNGMDMKCTGDIEWQHVKFKDGIAGILLGSSGSMPLYGDPKGRVDRTARFTLPYQIVTKPVGGGSLPTVQHPDTIRFPSCDAYLHSNSFYLKSNSFGQWLVNAILNIYREVFEDVLCDIIRQLGDYNDPDRGNNGGGMLSELLRQVSVSIISTATKPKPYPTPKAAEEAMETPLPEGIEDFTNSFRYDVLHVLLNDWLGGAAQDQPDRLVINTLVDRFTENSNGEFLFSRGKTNIEYGEVPVAFINQKAAISGMNTFKRLAIARNSDPSAPEIKYPYTLFNEFDMASVNLRAESEMVISPTITRVSGCPQRILKFLTKVNMNVKDPRFNVATLFAIVVSRLDYVHVGNVLDFSYENTNSLDRSLACVGKAMHDASFTDFKLNWGTLPTITLSGVIDDGLTRIISSVNYLFRRYYGETMDKWAEPLLQGQIQNINEAMREAITSNTEDDERNFNCPEVYEPNPELKSIVDFQSPAVWNIKESMQKTIELVDDPDIGINRVIGIMTEKLQEPWSAIDPVSGELIKTTVPGTINFGEMFNTGVPLDGKLATMKVHDFRVSNLNKLSKFDALNPLDSRSIHNEFEVANPDNPLQVQIKFSFDSDAAFEFDASEQWILTVEYHGIKVGMDIAMDVDVREFYPLTFLQLQSAPCYFHTIKNLALLAFNGTHEETVVDLQCAGCSLRNKLQQPVARKKMTEITNAVFAIMRESINNEDAVNAANRVVDRFAEKCVRAVNVSSLFEIPTPEPTEPLETPGELTIILANVIMYLLIAVFLSRLYYRYKLHQAEMNGAKQALSTESITPIMSHAASGKGVLDINRIGPSMFFDPNIPVAAKMVVPFMGLAIIAMFLSANLLNGGAVNVIAITEGGSEIDLDSLFDFTLVGSIDNMFQANVGGLGVIIAIASASWPYAKVVLTLVAFFLPPRVLPVNTRTSLLHFMDIAGKWSVVDQILMGLLLVVFNIQVQVPAPDNPDWYLADLIPDNFLTVIVRIVPEWGLYGFLMAALLSIFHGHIVMYFHNRILDKAWNPSGNIEDEDQQLRNAKIKNQRLPLRSHHFDRHLTANQEAKLLSHHLSSAPPGTLADCEVKGYKIKYSDLTGLLVLLAFNGALITLFAAVFLESFRFELGGVGGIAMNWISPGAGTIPLSILGASTGITAQARSAGETIGLIFIVISLVTIAFVVPLIQLGMNAVLWFAPLTFKDQKRLFRVVEGLQAWSALDVFMGAIIAAYFNLETFAGFMTTPYCAELDVVLQDIGVSSGLLTEDQATCFRVTPFISDGFIVLAIAVVLTTVINRFVVSSCRTSLVDREAFLKGCHNPYHVDPISGLPRRQQRTFCCLLSDMSLISLGIVKPIVLLGKADPNSPPRTTTQTPNARKGRSTMLTLGSFPWSRKFRSTATAMKSSVDEDAIRMYNTERVDRMHEAGEFEVSPREGNELWNQSSDGEDASWNRGDAGSVTGKPYRKALGAGSIGVMPGSFGSPPGSFGSPPPGLSSTQGRSFGGGQGSFGGGQGSFSSNPGNNQSYGRFTPSSSFSGKGRARIESDNPQFSM